MAPFPGTENYVCDLTVYLEALQSRIVGHRLERVQVVSPSLLRTVNPPLTQASGKIVHEIRRIGKQLVFVLEDDLFLVVHLMIAGRFRWRPPTVKTPGKIGLASFDFAHGTLVLTEAGTKNGRRFMWCAEWLSFTASTRVGSTRSPPISHPFDRS